MTNILHEQSLKLHPPIGGNPNGCDASKPASWDGQGGCTCVVCSRCDRHTGNGNQGHYWAYCSATKEVREYHFCCPSQCELEMAKG